MIEGGRRVTSLACVRLRVNEKEFIGCGRGWEAPETPDPRCDRCGRPARVTGTYIEVALAAQQAPGV